MQRVEGFVEIDAPVEVVFDRFSDLEEFPRWMGNIREVCRTGRRTSRWVSETAVPDVYAEWDAEVTVAEPDHRLAWRSVRGDIHADGEAVFSVTREGTTVLRVVLGYDTPLGRSGEQASRFFGVRLDRQLETDLEHFKRIVEREADRARRRERDERERAFAPVARGRGREGRAREEEERGQRRVEEERGPRRRGVRDEPGERFTDARESGRRGEEYRPRYALTPRERERERGMDERRFDPRVAEVFGRRGVDRLLDEPPRGRRGGRG